MEFTLAWQDDKLEVLSELRAAMPCELYTQYTVNEGIMLLTAEPAVLTSRNEISTSIARVIAGTVQKGAIENISKKALHELSIRERNTVNMLTRLRISQKGMSGKNSSYIACIASRVKDCLGKQPLHLEGFLCFRMRDYVLSWAHCMDEVINRVIQEHEYSEYIKILKDILSAQPDSGECIYISSMGDGRFKISDRNGICILDGSSIFAMERGLSPEDELICSLLMKAPAEIIIADSVNNLSTAAFETIMRVFEGKVRLSNAIK